MTDREPPPPPVLILTPPGLPGQTLAAALGQNPTGYDVPELNLEQMDSVDQLQRELIGIRGMQIIGLMRAIAQLYGGEQSGIAVEMARRWLNARAHLPTAHVARELVAKVAPRRLIAPVTAALFDRLAMKGLIRAFPDARWVHLTAHPVTYGRVLSASPAGEAALMLTGAIDESVAPALPDPQELWLMVEDTLAPVLADLPPDRVSRVDAARLAEDPQAVLADLAGALEMPADARALSAMGHPERSVFAGPGPMGAPLPGQIDTFATLAARFGGGAAPRLEGVVPWRPDGTPLKPAVRARATALGYA